MYCTLHKNAQTGTVPTKHVAIETYRLLVVMHSFDKQYRLYSERLIAVMDLYRYRNSENIEAMRLAGRVQFVFYFPRASEPALSGS